MEQLIVAIVAKEIEYYEIYRDPNLNVEICFEQTMHRRLPKVHRSTRLVLEEENILNRIASQTELNIVSFSML